MTAYKIWYDTKYFIHKDTTDELNVSWTDDISEAKHVHSYKEAVEFFFDKLGFNLRVSANCLHLLKDEPRDFFTFHKEMSSQSITIEK